MPHDMQVAPAVTMTLVAIETELKTSAKRIEKEQWRIAELLWGARGHFEKNDDKGFKKWVSQKTGLTYNTSCKHIETYTRFMGNKSVVHNQKSENPIPFSKLEQLASEKIPARVVQSTVEKLASKNPPTYAEVRQIAREAKPTYTPPPQLYRPSFETRSATKGDYTGNPEYLLDIHSDTSTETVMILAKYWRGKYHPDKGGDKIIFDRILTAEKAILAKRGVK